jgi:flavin-binding protein dodecin
LRACRHGDTEIVYLADYQVTLNVGFTLDDD